jgi:hypothetical protein
VQDSDDDEREETEEEFLERYAQTARDLEKEILEDAEGGEEEDGKEIELGKRHLVQLGVFDNQHFEKSMTKS